MNPPPASIDPDPSRSYERRHWIGLVVGGLFLAVSLGVPPPEGMAVEAWRVAGVGLLMASLWVTEAAPIPATALLPIVLFPLLGVADLGKASAPFADQFVFLFLGGFVIALAMEKSGLHRRIALRIVRMLGTGERAMVAGFMIAAALLSMWVSNTATALMMLPIATSLIAFKQRSGAPPSPDFRTALLLGLAYGCSIGGMGTLIGTPPNALLAGYLEKAHGITIGFGRWMLVGVPLVVVSLPLVYLILTRIAFPIGGTAASGAGDDQSALDRVDVSGPMSPAERRVAVVFGLTALAWMFRPLLDPLVPGLSDTGIAIAAAALLFFIPSGAPDGGRLMDWHTAESLPWGTLLLFGGGLSLAAAVKATGLAESIGAAGHALAGLPLPLVVAALGLGILLLTELTSNTATTAAFLPVVGAVAVGMGEDPVVLAVPAALAASGAFMLPVATPPNAVVFGSGRVSMQAMVRAGIWANLLFALLIPTLVLSLCRLFLDFE